MNTSTFHPFSWSNGTVTAQSLGLGAIAQPKPVVEKQAEPVATVVNEPQAPVTPVQTESKHFVGIHRNYIPKDASIIENEHGIVYTYESKGKLSGIAYKGKSKHSVWHYGFRSEAERQKTMQEFFSGLQASADYKAKDKAERDQSHSITVGEIVYNSWGYDQTNVEFYEVVKVSDSFVWLQELNQHMESNPGGSSMSGKVSPVAGTKHGEITKHKVSYGSSVKFKHGSGNVWDGKPKYCSWYA